MRVSLVYFATYSADTMIIFRRAIRLNWLCNPTGKRDGFRAVDWLVELMNLHIKVSVSSVVSVGSKSANNTFLCTRVGRLRKFRLYKDIPIDSKALTADRDLSTCSPNYAR